MKRPAVPVGQVLQAACHGRAGFVQCRGCEAPAVAVETIRGEPFELCRDCRRELLRVPRCAVLGCPETSSSRLPAAEGPGLHLCATHAAEAESRGRFRLEFVSVVGCGACGAPRREDEACPRCGSERRKR